MKIFELWVDESGDFTDGSITLLQAPKNIYMTGSYAEQIHDKLKKGYDDYKAGRTQNAAKTFEQFRERLMSRDRYYLRLKARGVI